MKLVSFVKEKGETPRFGALLSVGQDVLDFTAAAAGIPPPETPLAWFDPSAPCHQEAIRLAESATNDAVTSATLTERGAILPRSTVTLVAPVPRPGKVICIGLNYRDHAEESGMELPEEPVSFSKFGTSVVGPGEPVVLPRRSQEVDYEAELAVVIGRRAVRVSRENAYEHVLGYTNLNDVSARDFQFKDGQWQRGKSCDTFCPMGEYIVTRDEIRDPHELFIRFRLNGKTLQDSSTNQLVFGVPELIAFLSENITLEPGDVIATGTPPGVGFARKPPIYLKDGDRMEVEIEGLGVLGNPVVS